MPVVLRRPGRRPARPASCGRSRCGPCIDLGDGGDALFQGRGHAVEQQGGDAAADVGAGDARAHDAGADARRRAATACGCTAASATPGSFCSRWVMKKTAIRLREIGLPTSGAKLLGLDLQPVVERQIAALGDGVEGGQRGGELALGLGQHLAPGDGEGERRAAPRSGRPAAACVLPRALPVVRFACDHSRARAASSSRRSLGTASKTMPSSRARAGLDRSPAQIISAARDGPMRRVSRCVPPQPGIEADLHLGQADLRLGMRAGQAIVEAERQLQAAAHAGAVDGGHGGIRQRLRCRR